MTKTKFLVHLQDECPLVGCGRRIVSVEIGHKWVYLSVPYLTHRARMPRGIWDSLKATPMEDANA